MSRSDFSDARYFLRNVTVVCVAVCECDNNSTSLLLSLAGAPFRLANVSCLNEQAWAQWNRKYAIACSTYHDVGFAIRSDASHYYIGIGHAVHFRAQTKSEPSSGWCHQLKAEIRVTNTHMYISSNILINIITSFKNISNRVDRSGPVADDTTANKELMQLQSIISNAKDMTMLLWVVVKKVWKALKSILFTCWIATRQIAGFNSCQWYEKTNISTNWYVVVYLNTLTKPDRGFYFDKSNLLLKLLG